jgi:6-pyruvoyltetrahydropterin/6-carboxytetrahydropterin synthase
VSDRIRLVRTVTFSAAHRYFNPSLSEEENRRLYGSLYREQGFGHNFLVEAHVEGPVDPLTGMIVNLVEIDDWLKDIVFELDHQHLNDLPIYMGKSPTPERIGLQFFDCLSRALANHASGAQLAKVRVYEGETLWVDVCA